MNERYLCRGKCIDEREKTGEWITGYYLFAVSSCGSIHAISIPKSDPDKPTRTLEIDPNTLGQCTGLRDRNGALIFEGDIFNSYSPYSDVSSFVVAKVEWDNINTGYQGILWNQAVIYFRPPLAEVIGNIHDNPELMNTYHKTEAE